MMPGGDGISAPIEERERRREVGHAKTDHMWFYTVPSNVEACVITGFERRMIAGTAERRVSEAMVLRIIHSRSDKERRDKLF